MFLVYTINLLFEGLNDWINVTAVFLGNAHQVSILMPISNLFPDAFVAGLIAIRRGASYISKNVIAPHLNPFMKFGPGFLKQIYPQITTTLAMFFDSNLI